MRPHYHPEGKESTMRLFKNAVGNLFKRIQYEDKVSTFRNTLNKKHHSVPDFGIRF